VSKSSARKSEPKPAPKKAGARATSPRPPAARASTPARPADSKLAAPAPTPAPAPPLVVDEAKSSATTEAADRIVAGVDAAAVLTHAENLTSDKPSAATASARILDDLLAKKPDLLVSAIDRFAVAVASPNKRTVQTAAAALPVMAKLAPARVARHLPQLTEAFTQTSDVGKDGLVTTFAALCTASVAYQKRLEPVLELALSTADPKTLLRWAEVVLPSLKGEPHARARAVVEGRLPSMARPLAQPIATMLGIKLRPVGR
jgi:hypothetical protein